MKDLSAEITSGLGSVTTALPGWFGRVEQHKLQLGFTLGASEGTLITLDRIKDSVIL